MNESVPSCLQSSTSCMHWVLKSARNIYLCKSLLCCVIHIYVNLSVMLCYHDCFCKPVPTHQICMQSLYFVNQCPHSDKPLCIINHTCMEWKKQCAISCHLPISLCCSVSFWLFQCGKLIISCLLCSAYIVCVLCQWGKSSKKKNPYNDLLHYNSEC